MDTPKPSSGPTCASECFLEEAPVDVAKPGPIAAQALEFPKRHDDGDRSSPARQLDVQSASAWLTMLGRLVLASAIE